MPSRDEEILWCLKRLFTSHFWPKIASFNLSETESLVFAIKRVPKEAYWQGLSDGYVDKYVWHWFVFTIRHIKKLSEWSHDFANKRYLWTLSGLSIKQKAYFFWTKPNISIVIENNFVYSVHIFTYLVLLPKPPSPLPPSTLQIIIFRLNYSRMGNCGTDLPGKMFSCSFVR